MSEATHPTGEPLCTPPKDSPTEPPIEQIYQMTDALSLLLGLGPVLPPYAVSGLEDDADAMTNDEGWELLHQQGNAIAAELTIREQAARHALRDLQALPAAARKSRLRFVCHCPAAEGPCKLYEVYRWDGPPDSPLAGQPSQLVVAHTRKSKVAAFPDWFVENRKGIDPQWVKALDVGCKHGRGSMPVGLGELVPRALGEPARRRPISHLVGVSQVSWESRRAS